MVGPCVSHDGVIYAKTDNNTSICTIRMTRAREPGTTGHADLVSAQARFVSENSALFRDLHLHFSSFPTTIVNIYDTARERHADPHPKRLLRMAAFKDMEEDGFYSSDVWLHQCVGKIKTSEWAKPGKIPRMIGDLGVHASLEGAWVTQTLKEMYGSLQYIQGHRIRIVLKADVQVLAEVFREAVQPPTKYFFSFFSDDGIITLFDKKGKLRYYLTDISSCDTSHHSVFNSLEDSAPAFLKPGIKRVIGQLKKPLVIRCVHSPRLKVKLKLVDPDDTALYSGSTITTVLNDHGSVCIASAIITANAEEPDEIIAAARNAGYILDVTEVFHESELQFLKHSPVRATDGTLHAVLNPGVFLRASGTCRGDLPGRRCIFKRAALFQFALLQGMYPRLANPFIDQCRRSTGVSSPVPEPFRKVVSQQLEYTTSARISHVTIDDTEFFRRYRLTDSERLDLDAFATGKPRDFFNSPGLSKVLFMDYGLQCVDRSTDLPASYLWQR